MVFKKNVTGTEWEASGGNAKGRQHDFRTKITKEFVEGNWYHSQEILDRLVGFAKQDKQWAVKLYCTTILPYFLIKAPSQLEIMEMKDKDGMVDAFTKLSRDKADILRMLLSDKVTEDQEQAVVKLLKGE